MRSIKFDQIGNASGAPRVNRPVSREMIAVSVPSELAEGSSTALPVQREEAVTSPPDADKRPKA